MKKTVLIFTLAFLATVIYAQTEETVFFEDFEGDWTQNWHVDNGTWQVGMPTSGPDNAYEESNCAATVLAGNYPSVTVTRLIKTYPITIPSVNLYPRFTFWEWHSFNQHSNFRDHGIVKIKPSGSSVWIDLSSDYNSNSSNVWGYSSLDLSAYAGQDVQFAFELDVADTYYSADEDVGWYIDLVEIKTGLPVFNNPENWENGIGDWSVTNGAWEVGVPSSGPSYTHSGTKCLATNLAGNYANNSLTKVVSPIFTVPLTNQYPRFTFWEWHSFNQHSDFRDHGIVMIKPSGSSVWIDLSSDYNSNSSNVWGYSSLDLSDYAGQDVQIAFELDVADTYYSADEGVGWYIDLVEIKTGLPVFNNPENWENGIGDWSVTNGAWEVGAPSSGPSNTQSGTKCLATNLAGNYTNNSLTKVVSPIFTVPLANPYPRFTFWEWHSFNQHSNFRDHGIVKIKPSGSSVWIDLSPNYCSGSNVWSFSSIDLSDYAGQVVQIAFELDVADTYYSADEDVGWYIDDVIIEGFTGINIYEPKIENPSIYPNPFSSTTTIEFDNPNHSNYKLSVFDISGAEVFERDNIVTNTIVFEKGNLEPGIYILEIKGERVFRGKMVVKL
jgi:bacillopeptidase F (M6 metalloprotease family)